MASPGATAGSGVGLVSSLYGTGDAPKKDESANLQQQQHDLQAKILSILNGPGEVKQAPPTSMSQRGMAPPAPQARMGNGAPQGQPGMSSLINFDNPSVQKALDNLISSGPSLLQNISSPQDRAGLVQAPVMSRGQQPAYSPHQAGYGGMGVHSAPRAAAPSPGAPPPRHMYAQPGMHQAPPPPRGMPPQAAQRPY